MGVRNFPHLDKTNLDDSLKIILSRQVLLSGIVIVLLRHNHTSAFQCFQSLYCVFSHDPQLSAERSPIPIVKIIDRPTFQG